MDPSSSSIASSDAFLSGQGIPVALGQVESELARLWGPSAERIGGPTLEQPNVTRVSLANLVVAYLENGADQVESVLDLVVVRRPCRAIVLRGTDQAERQVSAEVAALCHLPAPGLPQVCSERIILSSGPSAQDLLPGTVFGLLEPDLPLVLWWSGDPRPNHDLFQQLASESARVLIDLPDPIDDLNALRTALDPALNPYSRDLNWFGVHRWRELVAQFFDPPGAAEALPRIARVQVEASAPQADRIPRIAAWLVAWLAGQLGWEPLEHRRKPGQVEAHFRGPSGPIAASILTRATTNAAPPRIEHVDLTVSGPDGEEIFSLSRPDPTTEEVQIRVQSPGRCALPRLVHAPELDPANRVTAALESSRHDPPYRNALPHLLDLLGA